MIAEIVCAISEPFAVYHWYNIYARETYFWADRTKPVWNTLGVRVEGHAWNGITAGNGHVPKHRWHNHLPNRWIVATISNTVHSFREQFMYICRFLHNRFRSNSPNLFVNTWLNRWIKYRITLSISHLICNYYSAVTSLQRAFTFITFI